MTAGDYTQLKEIERDALLNFFIAKLIFHCCFLLLTKLSHILTEVIKISFQNLCNL